MELVIGGDDSERKHKCEQKVYQSLSWNGWGRSPTNWLYIRSQARKQPESTCMHTCIYPLCG